MSLRVLFICLVVASLLFAGCAKKKDGEQAPQEPPSISGQPGSGQASGNATQPGNASQADAELDESLGALFDFETGELIPRGSYEGVEPA